MGQWCKKNEARYGIGLSVRTLAANQCKVWHNFFKPRLASFFEATSDIKNRRDTLDDIPSHSPNFDL